MIFYESPHRLLRTLNDFITTFGQDRQVSVSREISKIYEEHRRGTLIASAKDGAAGTYIFDIHLRGDQETVFFDV